MKFLGVFLCLIVLESNLFHILRWSEDRGVYDDLCYLRQAHLFQKFGLDGIDTDLARDTDRYFATKLLKLPDHLRPTSEPCHTTIQGKQVIQYPPGTGFVLSLFPEGQQVILLYAISSSIIFLFAAVAIFRATSTAGLALAIASGCVALYLMINPTKASYSMAPTMVACAIAGWLTSVLFLDQRRRPAIAAAIGMAIGIAVNFRLPNLFLASGYFVYFTAAFFRHRSIATFWTGLAFALFLLAGMSPTLIANTINAGSPFVTTYSSVDVVAPSLDWETLRLYATDLQMALLLLAGGWTFLMWRINKEIAAFVAANLLANIVFFATHPIYTQYYTIPIASLSLWTLLFTTVARRNSIPSIDPKSATAYCRPERAA